MRRHVEEHRDPHIDVVPLIDCILVLLIFFMVTTTFSKDAAMEIERPGRADKALVLATLALAWAFANMVYTLHYAHL